MKGAGAAWRPTLGVFMALSPVVLTGCLPSQLGGRPPSFEAFLARNGLEFVVSAPPPDLPVQQVVAMAQREAPFPAAVANPPVYGVLSCPVACDALLSQRGETAEVWFVSYSGTEYGLGDIAWVLGDRAGVMALSTSDNP